ncbi:hypothetical protein Lal_00013187 [Lupinus albus]|nr:hypothetical protein Lal_00013187 [Lupinus albus]
MQFTPEQHKSLLSIIQQQINLPQGHNTNQLSTMSSNIASKQQNTELQGKSSVWVMSCSAKSSCWILDTGATDHVCYTLSAFHTFKQIKPVMVTLPNGDKLYLTYVLYIPSFQYNLVSVSKLTQTIPCQANLYE